MVINKNIIQIIGEKEMDRKDFLKFSGLAVLSLVGLGKVVSVFTQIDNNKLAITKSHQQIKQGYSSGRYGS